MTTNKDLYKGDFNWYGQILKTKYTHTSSETQAFYIFCKIIAEEVKRTPKNVRDYFLNSKVGSHIITKDKKKRRQKYGTNN